MTIPAKYRAWILLALTVLFVLAVRVRVRDMPLERDEGEYAYAGQLILQGVPPYKEAYNMKLPGTYAAYAVIMALFGQTRAGIHLGVAFVNAGAIVLVFLIGRKLRDEITGIVAAVTFALLSLSQSVLGLAGHATHFVTVFALGGVLTLVAGERRKENGEGSQSSELSGQRSAGITSFLNSQLPNLQLFCSGVLFGLAFLMKQHGVFFGIFGGLYLLWTAAHLGVRTGRRTVGTRSTASVESGEEYGDAVERVPTADPGTYSRRENVFQRFRFSAFQLLPYAAGFVLPYAITCLVLWRAGVWQQFVFWTISYARHYAGGIARIHLGEILRLSLDAAIGANLVFWILPWFGLFGSEVRSQRSEVSSPQFFVWSFLLCSLGTVCVGFYFRQHYFITLLPVMALLTGIAVSHAWQEMKTQQSGQGFLVVIGLFLVGALASLVGNGSMWFGLSPEAVVRESYHSTLFPEAVVAADYLKEHTPKDARIAVLGSEPEIYFYSGRRSATGYLYTYPLMEEQPYAARMQTEMIGEIERAKPEFMVFVGDDFSWGVYNKSQRGVFDWAKQYWTKNFDVVLPLEIEEPGRADEAKALGQKPPPRKYILVLKRKTAP
jgi:4-amino-4-deoxy-L-arabinose transferase-like glycosyltransferase